MCACLTFGSSFHLLLWTGQPKFFLQTSKHIFWFVRVYLAPELPEINSQTGKLLGKELEGNFGSVTEMNNKEVGSPL